jgi:hypothetical protein
MNQHHLHPHCHLRCATCDQTQPTQSLQSSVYAFRQMAAFLISLVSAKTEDTANAAIAITRMLGQSLYFPPPAEKSTSVLL